MANENNLSSVVGVRASWTCFACRAIEKTYQLMMLSQYEALTLPPGWWLLGHASVCSKHSPASLAEEIRGGDGLMSGGHAGGDHGLNG